MAALEKVVGWDPAWIKAVSGLHYKTVRGAIASEVLPWLWLGRGEFAVFDDLEGGPTDQLLEKAGITAVVTVANDTPQVERAMKSYGAKYEWLHLEVGDFGTDQVSGGMSRYFARAFAFIDSAKDHDGGRVFVHCANGSNRSPTLTIAYMVHTGLTLPLAYLHVLSHRPHISPLPDNQAALRVWVDPTPKGAAPVQVGQMLVGQMPAPFDFGAAKVEAKKNWKRVNGLAGSGRRLGQSAAPPGVGAAKRRGSKKKKKKKLTTDFGKQMYLEALHHPADDGTSEWTLAVGSLCDLKTGGKWASERVGAGERPSAVILEFHAAKPGVKCRGAWCIVFESEGNKMHARVPVSRIRVPRR